MQSMPLLQLSNICVKLTEKLCIAEHCVTSLITNDKKILQIKA